ncbi:hypothetical protein [Thermoleptolyngbya sp.]
MVRARQFQVIIPNHNRGFAGDAVEWLLPGQGRCYQGDRQTTAEHLQRCLLGMETQ